MEKLELGRVYVTQCNMVVGPMETNQDSDYPFIGECDGVRQSYTAEGHYHAVTPSEHDIDFEASAKRFGCMPIPAQAAVSAAPQKFKWQTVAYDGHVLETYDTEDAAKIAQLILTADGGYRVSIYKKEA